MASAIPRRTFLDRLGAWSLGLLGVGALWGVLSYLYPPALRRRGTPVRVARVGELHADDVKHFDYHGEPAVLVQGPEGLTAMSLICTHLGCSVRWNADRRRFICPCHKGMYDANGQVLFGPPPSPLERLPVSIRGNTILVG